MFQEPGNPGPWTPSLSISKSLTAYKWRMEDKILTSEVRTNRTR